MKSVNYLRNVTKSMAYVAVDVANSELMENTIDFAKSNKEFIAATYAVLRNPAAAIKKGVKAIQESKIYQALDYGARNAVEDLRTGNFYNKERIDRDAGKLSGLANADDWNDLSEFGIDDNWDDILNGDFDSEPKSSSKVTKEITSGDIKIVESIEGSNAAAANATVNAVLQSSDMQIKNARINSGNLYLQNERLFGGLHKDMTILGTTIDNIQKVTSASLQNLDKNVSDFFTSESKLSAERNATLKEMLELMKGQFKPAIDKEKEIAEKNKKNKVRWSNINSSGMPELADYFEAIKANINKEIGGMLPMMNMNEDSNFLAEFAVSPWQYVIEPIISGIIPATFKLASKELDKSLSSVFGQFIGRLANRRDSSGIWGILSKFAGINTGVNKSIATDKYEKGPIPFDGYTRKAIIDVIPSYLRRIEAFLTRLPEQTYDYDSGIWVTMNSVKKKHEDIHKNAVNSATKEIMDAMKPTLDMMKASNRTDAESLEKAIEEFRYYLYERNGEFNPNLSAERNGIDYRYQNLLKHYKEIVIAYKNFDRTRYTSRGGEKVRNTNYSARLGISKAVLDAKDTEERMYRDLESKIGPMQQYFAAMSVDKHGKWDKDTNKFSSGNILLESKDKASNTIFDYLRNMNAELRWQRESGFNDMLNMLMNIDGSLIDNPVRATTNDNNANATESVFSVAPNGEISITNNNRYRRRQIRAVYNSAYRNAVRRNSSVTFNDIYNSLNRNKEEERRLETEARKYENYRDKALDKIRKGEALDVSVLMHESNIDEEDSEELKERVENFTTLLQGLAEEYNSKKYVGEIRSLNSNSVANFFDKNFYADNAKSIEEVRKEIEKAEKEAEKESNKDSDLDEKEKGFLSGVIEKVKAGSTFAGGIAGATADMFTNLMYTTDRAIYEMMYKTELKDDEDASQEYNGFMDMIGGKINKTFERVRDDIKNDIIDPFKKRLGLDEEWEKKFKDSLGEIGSSLWKNFIDANKDVYGPLWGMVKTELGFKDGETIAEKQRRANRKTIDDDLTVIDNIKSIYDLEYIDMMSEYGLNPLDYGTNFDAAINDLRKAAQERYIKNTNNLKDLSKSHNDDEERRIVINFANATQLLDIAAAHGIEESEILKLKNADGTWDTNRLREYIEDYIFRKINENNFSRALNTINITDDKGNKRFTDEQIESIKSGEIPINWQEETRKYIAQNAINKVKNQSDESLLHSNLTENKDKYDVFRAKALGFDDTTNNSLLETLNANGIDITPYLDGSAEITLDKAVELLLGSAGNNEYQLIARNKGFKYNAENKESNISQIVKDATAYNTNVFSGLSDKEAVTSLLDNTYLYNKDAYNSARVKALGFVGSIDEKRAKLKELTGRSDEDLKKYTTDEQLDKEYLSFIDSHNLGNAQLADLLGFSNERAKQIDQIIELIGEPDDTIKNLNNQQLLEKYLELKGISLDDAIAKALLNGTVTKESIINMMGENLANQLRNNNNLNSEATWSAEHYRHTHKGMDINYEIADLMGVSSDRESLEKHIGDAAVEDVLKRFDINKTQTGDFSDVFNSVVNYVDDGARIKEAEQNGLKGTLRQKQEIVAKLIENAAEIRKRRFAGNEDKLNAIDEERDRDIERIKTLSEYELSDYFIRNGFKNNAEGTLNSLPFMGKTMLSKNELLFNSKGVSRVDKTDAYTLDEPTHILNSEDSYDLLSSLGVDKKYLGSKSTIEQDLANENRIKDRLYRTNKFGNIANNADSVINITNTKFDSDKVLSDAKSHIPEAAAGGLIGGILSLVFDIVGGPLVGAAIGAGTNLIKNSDTLKDALFGKKINENGERDDSGFISKTIVDNARKAAPDMFKYGLAGIIPGLITGIGPIGGLLAGAAIGILKNNEAFTNKYFGEHGKLTIKSEDKEILQKLIPGAIKGAGVGALAGLAFGGPFGLMGNAIIGSALGMMASTSEFKEAMLGTDINGQREGGLMGILKEAFDPLIDAFDNVKSKLIGAIDENIVDPLSRFIRPAIHALPKLVGAIPKLVVDWIDKRTENIRRDLAGKIKDFILPKAEFVAKMLSPLTSIATLPLKIPGKIIGGAGDRLRKFNIKRGDLVGMSASEAVEWMDDKGWGLGGTNEVDPLLRLAAKTTNKNDAMQAATLLNAMNSTEAGAKRAFNDKNHNLNRMLEMYKTADGKRLSKDQIRLVLGYAKDGKYDKISDVLTGTPLNGSNQGMSKAEFNDLMDNKGLKEAISGVAESHKRKELIRNMSNGELTDELRSKLAALGINPSDFDITNKKDRAKFANYLSQQALHLEENPEEAKLDQDNHDNLSSMNDTLGDIRKLLFDIAIGANKDPEEYAKEVNASIDAGQIKANKKYDRAYKYAERSLRHAGINTDNLSDKAKDAIGKSYYTKGVFDNSNENLAKSMTTDFINLASEYDVDFENVYFISADIQPLVTKDAMEVIRYCNETQIKRLKKWLGNNHSDIVIAIKKGRYTIDADVINILSNDLSETASRTLEENCRLINQSKAWDQFNSLKQIYELSLNDKFVIRGNSGSKYSTATGNIPKDIASATKGVRNAIFHPIRTGKDAIHGITDTASVLSSRVRNGIRGFSNWLNDEETEPIASHGIGTFLLNGAGKLAGKLAKGITGLFKKDDEESRGESNKPGIISKVLSALSFNNADAYSTAAPTYRNGGQFDETDDPNDGKDIVQIGSDFGKVKKGSDGSVELDTEDANTKQIINKLNLKEKITEKVQQAQIKATEILKNAFDTSDTPEGKNGKLKWWQIALTGVYLWKSGILGKLYNGIVKPLWTNTLKPWIDDKAIPWINDVFLPGIGDFFSNLGSAISGIADTLWNKVLVPAWTEHISPWLTNTVGPWIMDKALPALGKLIGEGVKFVIEALPAILKGSISLAGGIVDAFTGNTTNAGATTTIDPSTLSGDGKFTDENGKQLSLEDIQNGNYEKIYNSENAEGIVNDDGTITFKDRSFHGSSYLKTAANASWHAFINPRMGMKTAKLLAKSGDITYNTLKHLGTGGKIVGRTAQFTGKALAAPTKGAAKLGEKVYSKLFKNTSKAAINSAESLIEQNAKGAVKGAVIATGESVAKETAEVATKKSGVIARMIEKLSGFIDNLLSNSKVASKVAKVAADIGESSVGKFIKNLKDKLMKVFGEAGEKAAKKMGVESVKDALSKALIVVSIVQGVIDFGLGWDRAESILGVTDCTPIEKLVCAAVNAAFNYFSILSIVPGVNWACRTILGFFEKDLKERQAKADAEYQKYLKETGSTKTKEEYLASKYSVSGKVGDWVSDKATKAWDWTKKNAKNIGSTALKVGKFAVTKMNPVALATNITKTGIDAVKTLWDNRDEIKDVFKDLAKIVFDIKTIANSGDVDKLLKYEYEPKDKEATGIKGVVNTALGAVAFVNKILNIPGAFIHKAINKVIDAAKDEFNKTKNVISSIPKVASNTLTVIKNGDIDTLYSTTAFNNDSIIGKIGNAIYNMLRPIFALPTLVFKLVNNFDKIIDYIKEKIQPFKDFCSNPVSFIDNYLNDDSRSNSGATTVWNTGKSVVSTVRGWFGLGSYKYGTGYYKQTDPEISNIRFNDKNDTKYQTIGDSGCGPAAAVNAIYGRGNEVVNAAEYAIKNGYKEPDGGTMPGFFNDYFAKNGYTSQTTSNKQQLRRNILSGIPTVLMGTDPNGVSSSTPYGSNPHYVTATGVDSNGHIIIQDPESKYDNQLYSMDDVMNMTQFGVSAFGTGKYGRGTEQDIWNYLKNDLKLTDAGAAGLMGNLYAESSLKPSDLEGTYEKKFGMTDASYTKAVDNGTYSKNKFINDKAGYGLAQWTYKTRKKALYEYIKNKGLSIASVEGQLGYLGKELKGYGNVLNTLKTATNVRDASDVVMLKFEKPKDTSEKKRQLRASYGNKYYNKYSGKTSTSVTSNTSTDSTNSNTESTYSENTSASKITDLLSLTSTFFSNLFSSNNSSYDYNTSSSTINYSFDNSSYVLTNQATAIVKVAQGEVGTKEKGVNKIKYVDWYFGKSGSSLAWCCVFVAWCANKAGIPTSIIPKVASCTDMYNGIISKGGKVVSSNNVGPGDIMFVSNGSGGFKHIGIVEGVKDGKILTIEGNYSDKVSRVKRPTGNRDVLVFIRPAYTNSTGTGIRNITSFGKGTGSKPLAKYGQFKNTINGKGSRPINTKPLYKNIQQEIDFVNQEQYGTGTSISTRPILPTKFGGSTQSTDNSIIVNLINIIIKVLYEIADNTDKLNTVVSILNKNLDIDVTPQDISDSTGKYESLKSKLQKSLNAASNTSLNNNYANTVDTSSMSAVIEIMNSIAAE